MLGPQAGYQPAGYYGVKTAPCSGRIAPAGCSLHQNWRPGLPHKCGIALIRLPCGPTCGSASIGSPQQSMRTKVSIQGCTSCDTQATPKQLQVFRSFHGTPPRYPFSFPFLHTSVCAELSCPSHALGSGPGQWGFSKVLLSGDGAGVSGKGNPTPATRTNSRRTAPSVSPHLGQSVTLSVPRSEGHSLGWP